MKTKNTKLLKIIIPVFNAENHIENTAKSLLDEIEGRSDISILFILNGCHDRSYDILKPYTNKKNVSMKVLEEGSKVNAMNLGAFISRAWKYVAFLDDDSFVSWSGILASMRELSREKKLNVVSLQPLGVINSKKLLGRIWQRIFRMSVSNKFLKKPVHNMAGRFMMFKSSRWIELPKQIIDEDIWLTLRHAPNFKIITHHFVRYNPSSSLFGWWRRHSVKGPSRLVMREIFGDSKVEKYVSKEIYWKKVANPLYFSDSIFFLIYRLLRRLNRIYGKKRQNSSKYFSFTWDRDKSSLN